MATKRYAENLIGNWETNQYEPQRQVTKDIYQTNWNKLTQDLDILNKQLARNFETARQGYTNNLQNTSESSFANMYNAEANLANRGLAASGLLNNINQSNIEQVGNVVDKNLQNLLDTNKATIEGNISGVTNYGSKLNSLGAGLADSLGDITDAETQNLQNYYNLISDIIESASRREASNASSKTSLRQKQAELDAEQQEQDRYRLLFTLETLNDDSLSDNDKRTVLTREVGLTAKQADDAISSRNYTLISDKLSNAQRQLEKRTSNLNEYRVDTPIERSLLASGTGILPRLVGAGITALGRNSSQNRVNNLQNELSNYTYKDLYDILNS